MSNNTPQDTFDALRNELPENEIIEMLVDYAIGYLAYDDANPNVGMGMFVFEAIEKATNGIQRDAKRWKRNVYISDSTKKKAEEIVKKKRGR